MNSLLDIKVQKLFVVALVLKVGSSFLGWWFRDPWILGLAIPLLLMSAYIALGYFRRDNDVTDEKFADTCYYLGFIFTITSIIFSLFDLPQIGSRIQDIAVRFGAAMVSTVLGVAVRVYLVSFKKDVADAIKDAEDAVLDASRKFTEQLTVAVEKLRDFEVQVDNSAKSSVERVNVQVENLSKNHADKLTAFFTDLTSKNEQAFTSALDEVKSASQKLATSVDGYSLGMRANLGSIEAKITAFTDAVSERLKTTTFPDDYFAKQLDEPLNQLKGSSAALASGIKDSLQEVTSSTAVLSTALKKLRDKSSAAEGSLDTVLKLTQQQQAILDSAQGQVSSLEALTGVLGKMDQTLEATIKGLASNGALTTELAGRVSNVVADGAETRRTLEAALLGVTEALRAQVEATGTVTTTIASGAATSGAATERLVNTLDKSVVMSGTASAALNAATNASSSALVKLEAIAAADMKAAQALTGLNQHASVALNRVDTAVEQLQTLVRQLASLESAMRVRSEDARAPDHSQRLGLVSNPAASTTHFATPPAPPSYLPKATQPSAPFQPAAPAPVMPVGTPPEPLARPLQGPGPIAAPVGISSFAAPGTSLNVAPNGTPAASALLSAEGNQSPPASALSPTAAPVQRPPTV